MALDRGLEGRDSFDCDAEGLAGLAVPHIHAILLRNCGERADVDLLSVIQHAALGVGVDALRRAGALQEASLREVH